VNYIENDWEGVSEKRSISFRRNSIIKKVTGWLKRKRVPAKLEVTPPTTSKGMRGATKRDSLAKGGAKQSVCHFFRRGGGKG